MSAIKTVLFFACVIWLTNEVFVVRPARAVDITPSVMKTSSFKGASDANVYVTSWIDNGVKCTAITTGAVDVYKNIQASISCVKL